MPRKKETLKLEIEEITEKGCERKKRDLVSSLLDVSIGVPPKGSASFDLR